MSARLDAPGALTLRIQNPETTRRIAGFGQPFFARRADDLVPDHNHLMHLYAIRQPGLDVVYHLHPEPAGSGIFRLNLPSMPAGSYRLYADIVHANGFPETLVSTIQVAALTGRRLSGDDASATAQPWNHASASSTVFSLPEGYQMEWLRDSPVVRSKQPAYFCFRLVDPQGQPAQDMSLYMGMLGHAAFVKTDGSVFAHIHPTGSGFDGRLHARPALRRRTQHGRHEHARLGVAACRSHFSVWFPDARPLPDLRQMKHAATIETGVFDADVQ